MPSLIRSEAATHLRRLLVAADARALQLAQARARGFVEGLKLAKALEPATIKALHVAVEDAAAARCKELSR
ncbi:hypothetical protein KFQ04_01330 [Pseudomonas synxantha]|nr:hypothetical protein KFQ04_01330 [Pseudomonas synxantha]